MFLAFATPSASPIAMRSLTKIHRLVLTIRWGQPRTQSSHHNSAREIGSTDPTTAFLDPFAAATTLVLICNITDPITGQTYSRDARYIAQKAESYLKTSGMGEAAYFGPEAEFFVFNEVRYGQGINYAMHEIDSKEGTWNTGTKEAPNLGHKPRQKEGYFPHFFVALSTLIAGGSIRPSESALLRSSWAAVGFVRADFLPHPRHRPR